jgi:hypothetical protein
VGVPEGRVYSRRLVFVSVRTIKRHHHRVGFRNARGVKTTTTEPGA